MKSTQFSFFTFCSKRQIAVVNFVMHEVHCRRNIVLCENCDEPVPKSELQEHFDEYHVKVKCEKCGQSVEKLAVEDHMVILQMLKFLKLPVGIFVPYVISPLTIG